MRIDPNGKVITGETPAIKDASDGKVVGESTTPTGHDPKDVVTADGGQASLAPTSGEVPSAATLAMSNAVAQGMHALKDATNDPKLAAIATKSVQELDLDALKNTAALAALYQETVPLAQELARRGDKLHLVVGTGSTSSLYAEALGQMFQKGELTNLVCCSTSEKTTAILKKYGIEPVEVGAQSTWHLAVDGADEITRKGDAIKGGGGALEREKAFEKHAKKLVIIIDPTKLSEQLGTKFKLPVAVSPESWQAVSGALEKLGGAPALRKQKDKDEPFVTDNGSYVIDVKFADGIADPKALAKELEALPGLREHGLFLGMAKLVIVGTPKGPESITISG